MLRTLLSLALGGTQDRNLFKQLLSLWNSSQAHGLKAIKFSYSKPAAIEASGSGGTAQQFAFLGGKLNLRITIAYSLMLQGTWLVITVVGYSSQNSEHKTFYPHGSRCSPIIVSRQTLRGSHTSWIWAAEG